MSKKLRYSDEELAEAVKNSASITGTLRRLGMCIYGSNATAVKRRIQKANIDTSHFTGQAWNRGTKKQAKKEDVLLHLTENSTLTSLTSLKKRLISAGILSPVCVECGVGTNWNGKYLVHHLDHANGIRSDNRLENLRLLCPNCHSQTSTYAGRNSRYKNWSTPEGMENAESVTETKPAKIPRSKQIRLCDCGVKISYKALRCARCSALYGQKVVWPSDEDLKKLLWEVPTTRAAKMLGVSDKAIDKRCKKRGIIKPARGYWEKVYHALVA